MYRYSVDQGNPSQLNNFVQTVDPKTGITTYENVGVDYELFADARENQHHKMLPEIGVNCDISLRGPILITIPTVYPGYSHSFGRLRMQTFNKVIYRSGLLEETIAFDEGANISSTNILRDRESGEVVLKDMENEFSDKHYALTYPARWISEFKGMNGVYRNVGLQLKAKRVDSGFMELANASDFLTQGDELILVGNDVPLTDARDGSTYGMTDTYKQAWVMGINGMNTGVFLIDRKGDVIASGTYDIKVLRSGYGNAINASASKFNLKSNPISDNRLVIPAADVLSSEVTEFSNHWQTYGLFESALPIYECQCSQNQIIKKNAVTLLGELVNTLLTRGDNKRTVASITSSYSTGAVFFSPRFGNTPRAYHGELSGSLSRGVITPIGSTSPDQQCELNIRMADGSTFFPDSIVGFSIDERNFDDGDSDCDDIYTATGTITYLGEMLFQQSLSSVPPRARKTAKVTITTCIPLVKCETVAVGRGEIRCLSSGRAIVNPFVTGVLGNWHALSEYRFATTLKNNEPARTGGAFQEFQNFFSSTFPLRIATRTPTSAWIQTNTLTLCDNFGRSIESKDALGNFSSKLYGYGFSLPVADATNAKHGSIAFDGFEDYNFANQPNNPFNNCPVPAHFKPSEFDALDREFSHSGKYSLPVSSGTSVTRSYAIRPDRRAMPLTSRAQYSANSHVIISPFSPERQTTFFVSVWIKKKESETLSIGATFLGQIARDILPIGSTLPILLVGGASGPSGGASGIVPPASDGDLVVTSKSTTGVVSTIGNFKTEGNIIDGWQQLNGKFEVGDNVESITIEMRGKSGVALFDDLRIQPFNSVMKTSVYDPLTMQLMATLDENNYATYYIYDQQEQLIATKKETEDGIFTIQETRSGTSKIVKP